MTEKDLECGEEYFIGLIETWGRGHSKWLTYYNLVGSSISLDYYKILKSTFNGTSNV